VAVTTVTKLVEVAVLEVVSLAAMDSVAAQVSDYCQTCAFGWTWEKDTYRRFRLTHNKLRQQRD
jgi:hypothetical protein